MHTSSLLISPSKEICSEMPSLSDAKNYIASVLQIFLFESVAVVFILRIVHPAVLCLRSTTASASDKISVNAEVMEYLHNGRSYSLKV